MSLFGKTIREVHFRMTAFMPRAAALLLLLAAAAQGADRPLFDTALRRDLLTPEEKAWLEAHPNIRVAVTKKYEPVEFFDDVNGGYWGITSEYFNLMESRIGRRFEYVNPSTEQWAQLDPAARGADVVTASAETPERVKYWSYTKTYLSLPTYLIARHTAKDDLTLHHLKGGRVAVVKNWAAEEYLRTNFPNLQIDAVPDAATGLRKASFGLVDAFVSELPVATEWMEKEAIANLKIAGEAGYTYDLGISVRKDWPELLGIFEKALATITPAEREAIYKR